MHSQLRQLLHWQLRFQSRGILFWLVSGGYVLLAGPMILWVLERMDSSRVPVTGRHYFTGLVVIHWILTPAFALFRSSATVSDRTADVLSLVKITNLPAIQWTLYRVLTLILEYLPIWALRLPFYFYAYCLGGLTVDRIAVYELLFWTVYLSIGWVGLLTARLVETAQTARMLTAGVFFMLEFMLWAPMIVVATLQEFVGTSALVAGHWREITEGVSHLSIVRQLWSPPIIREQWPFALGAIGLYLAIGLWALSRFRRVVFSGVGLEESGKRSAGQATAKKALSSRRVWQDALAWQAYEIHGGGKRTVHRKLILGAIVVGTLLLLASDRRYMDPMAVVSFSVVALVLSAGSVAIRPGDCLTRELKAGTLSTLALLPLDSKDMFRGWARGTRKLCAPEFYAATLLFLLASFLAPQTTLLWLGLLIGLLLAEPCFFMNSLVGLWLSALPVGCLATLLLIGVPITCVAIGVSADQGMGFAMFIIASVLGRFALLALLPNVFAERLERQP